MPHAYAAVQFKEEWNQWSEGDESAGDRLVEAFLPLVEYHVKRIGAALPKSVQVDELRSHGMLGLYDALRKFDHTRELKFDTYASFRIRGAIIDGLRQQDWLPRSLREKSKKIEQASELLEQKYGRYVSAGEVAVYLGLSEEEVLQAMNESYLSHQLSIDETAQDSEKDETFTAAIPDNRTLTPEQELDKKARIEELAEVIKTLNEKEQTIISLFYFEELTLTEIGELLNLSTSRISQIHSRCIFKLQQKLRKERSRR
ncbi:FliA/WhiG family RNA polymerase sigma factor [Evansella sp. LMS18]|uniref:FliA/WhiG family RNA polymerase sigma factor n=1 Tax=Evansella sp. LMS18 TaxID=2924033 RepID=UPI0020D084EE|nr:FliA/WhiG family RNA polymerase sigma factor [Evansella sp. LMS18]UTR10843.1 FliA/WhiG family RNA polymerase sigma factor [Evansella sp. LMS18]